MNAYYQAIASEYARHRQTNPAVVRNLILTGRIGPTSTVLEVGCGTGNYLLALEKAVGCACWGMDPSEAMLAQARASSARACFSCASAERMDLPSNHFDLIFCVDVVHHLADRGQVFRECYRLARHGGRFCIVTDSPSIIRRREPLATYFPDTVAVDLARYPSLETLRTELRDARFADLAETEVEFRRELDDIDACRARTFSCLRLIPDDAFERGVKCLEQAMRSESVFSVSRYLLLWAAKPPAT